MRPLLAGLIDYAGLFPPAALSMRDVVANYTGYRTSPHAWMLGRLVVPVARLAECRAEWSALDAGRRGAPWQVTALATDATSDFDAITRWNVEHGGELLVDSCEVKAATAEDIARIAAAATSQVSTFVEIPVDRDPASLLDAIKQHDLFAKIRTGGVTEDAFPTPADVARFIVACAGRDIRFKATAGLHHPLRGTYRLTYAADAPSGTMYGFLNIFLAAALARIGQSDRVEATLCAEDPAAFTLIDDATSAEILHSTRAQFALSFGSCSFTEPVEDLQQLGFL